MTHEGCWRKHVKKWDVFEDLEAWAILKSEWTREVRHALIARRARRRAGYLTIFRYRFRRFSNSPLPNSFWRQDSYCW